MVSREKDHFKCEKEDISKRDRNIYGFSGEQSEVRKVRNRTRINLLFLWKEKIEIISDTMTI